MKNITKVYDILLKDYGSQNWWPTTLKGSITPTYHGKEIDDNQRFEIIIGSILTQNTSWNNVCKAIINLNKENILKKDPQEKIISIKHEKLAELIRPSGYFNQKASRLKTISKYFSKEKIKEILKKDLSQGIREDLLSIKGIGPETADSILLYAFSKPVFVVDAYTRRIFSRLKVIEEKTKYEDIRSLFEKDLSSSCPESRSKDKIMINDKKREKKENIKKKRSSSTGKIKIFNEYHALIVEHAKRNCKKKPECSSCNLSVLCKNMKNI